MNNLPSIQEARAAAGEILNVLGINRVVYVDDANGKDIAVEDIIAAAKIISPEQLYSAFPELGEKIPEDDEVVSILIREIWMSLDAAIQTQRGKSVLIEARKKDGSVQNDLADVSILSELIPGDLLISISPAQWQESENIYLEDSIEGKTLFLFDRDFSEAGGDPEEGLKIISSLLAKDKMGGLICGLLTHTVSPGAHIEQWEELSIQHNIPKDRFIVIPKLNLSQAPLLVAHSLKFTALSPDFANLKKTTKTIIEQAALVAAQEVEKVSIYDLDHIIFQASSTEGLWEPDMLFRLHALFHRVESRRLAHNGGNLESITAKLRNVSNIPTNLGDYVPPSSAWALQRAELYESVDYINGNHLPIEIGDIFQKVGTESTKNYILLAQPCDLMVRSNGKRQPELKRVVLAEVVKAGSDAPPPYSEVMPYFSDSPDQKWYVRLKLIHFVDICVLDLCVFNKDGEAKIILNSKPPTNIRPGLKMRHNFLCKLIANSAKKIEKLAPIEGDTGPIKQLKERLKKDLGDLFFNDDLFKGVLEDNGGVKTVTFNCKRVGRISQIRAMGFLMSYTSTIGRPAYDIDFAR